MAAILYQPLSHGALELRIGRQLSSKGMKSSLWPAYSIAQDFRDNSEATERYLNSIGAKFLSQRNLGFVPPTSTTGTRLPWTFYPNGAVQ